MRKLTSREIMEILSIREWSMLCTLADTFGPKQQMMLRHGSGSDVQAVAGKLLSAKFDVVKIMRHKDTDSILCFLDFGKGDLRWFELTKKLAMKKSPVTLSIAA